MAKKERKMLLTLPEVAQELVRSHMTVWRLASSGKLPATKTPAGWIVSRDDLDAFKKLDRKRGRPPKKSE
jgi:excisionase family DNA binding protein